VAPLYAPPPPPSLQITLEPGSTFNAEAYSSDLGLASEGDDVRLNLGERLLRALFAQWKQPAPRASPQPAPPPELAFRPLDETPVRLCEDGRVVARTLASRLSELPSDAVPHWVAQAVLHGQYTPKEPLKMSFFLQPHPESGLPPLPADCNKLSAAKVRMRGSAGRGGGEGQIRPHRASAFAPLATASLFTLALAASGATQSRRPATILFCPPCPLASHFPACSPPPPTAAGAQGAQGRAVR
jgi:hypothetical protein